MRKVNRYMRSIKQLYRILKRIQLSRKLKEFDLQVQSDRFKIQKGLGSLECYGEELGENIKGYWVLGEFIFYL